MANSIFEGDYCMLIKICGITTPEMVHKVVKVRLK
jgi:phosphoribosylanthranilate isomerase